MSQGGTRDRHGEEGQLRGNKVKEGCHGEGRDGEVMVVFHGGDGCRGGSKQGGQRYNLSVQFM